LKLTLTSLRPLKRNDRHTLTPGMDGGQFVPARPVFTALQGS
jgi:hypothetical protein